MQSKTWHESLGQYKGSVGRGTPKVISVLIVGLGPGFLGSVFKFVRLVPKAGGTKLFRLKFMNAFWTGRIPGDARLRKPRTFMDT